MNTKSRFALKDTKFFLDIMVDAIIKYLRVM